MKEEVLEDIIQKITVADMTDLIYDNKKLKNEIDKVLKDYTIFTALISKDGMLKRKLINSLKKITADSQYQEKLNILSEGSVKDIISFVKNTDFSSIRINQKLFKTVQAEVNEISKILDMIDQGRGETIDKYDILLKALETILKTLKIESRIVFSFNNENDFYIIDEFNLLDLLSRDGSFRSPDIIKKKVIESNKHQKTMEQILTELKKDKNNSMVFNTLNNIVNTHQEVLKRLNNHKITGTVKIKDKDVDQTQGYLLGWRTWNQDLDKDNDGWGFFKVTKLGYEKETYAQLFFHYWDVKNAFDNSYNSGNEKEIEAFVEYRSGKRLYGMKHIDNQSGLIHDDVVITPNDLAQMSEKFKKIFSLKDNKNYSFGIKANKATVMSIDALIGLLRSIQSNSKTDIEKNLTKLLSGDKMNKAQIINRLDFTNEIHKLNSSQNTANNNNSSKKRQKPLKEQVAEHILDYILN